MESQALPALDSSEITRESIVMAMRQMAVAMVSQSTFVKTGEWVVYVMGFSNGVTKVGQTSDYRARSSSHIGNRRVRGHALISNWWMRTSSALEDEKFLKDAAKVLGGTPIDRTREWFTGVDADLIIAGAERFLAPAPKPPLSYYFPRWGPEDFPPPIKP